MKKSTLSAIEAFQRTMSKDDTHCVVNYIEEVNESEVTRVVERKIKHLATKENLAQYSAQTKDDLMRLELSTQKGMVSLKSELSEEMKELRAELKDDMQMLRAELKDDINLLRAEQNDNVNKQSIDLKEEISNLRVDIYKQSVMMLKWSLVFWASQLAFIYAFLYFFLNR
ncbi:CCDC90 family protein [Sphingobacterium psychroaquaticum]|uniref:DUF1640 domain-containing protein n=1 Tax=Sphingobacterium psychroaquaticum TaxID=561061 RepID=A0A1X7IY23_9SPHI|nr:DUF1640 domain-containing protein [Sphingobacterium psychroaquaticum]SMG19757.1 Protein of unknown function [Sphingobacterium psychroaquaticum]